MLILFQSDNYIVCYYKQTVHLTHNADISNIIRKSQEVTQTHYITIHIIFQISDRILQTSVWLVDIRFNGMFSDPQCRYARWTWF